MVNTHQPIIAAQAQRNSANLALVQQFVILSVQVPLSRVSTDLDIVRAEREEDRIPGILYGWKQAAYYDTWFEREERYHQAMDIHRLPFIPIPVLLAVAVWKTVPGIGVHEGEHRGIRREL